MYIILSIWISKIQFACYTQREVPSRRADMDCLFGFQRYNLHAIHNIWLNASSIASIVYWDFKDTICMLYTTSACTRRPKTTLSIWISKIQFACYTQLGSALIPKTFYCLLGFQRTILGAKVQLFFDMRKFSFSFMAILYKLSKFICMSQLFFVPLQSI